MDSDAVFCSDLMKLLDERLAVFKKRLVSILTGVKHF